MYGMAEKLKKIIDKTMDKYLDDKYTPPTGDLLKLIDAVMRYRDLTRPVLVSKHTENLIARENKRLILNAVIISVISLVLSAGCFALLIAR